ncbi:endonuclease-reverse transcriptase [Elysia marginata]|uniref:Endonuclease-reverse transcriptase n=1 Tax=Elysia marginata TaxID=1093978 RepID=A0AAV4HTY6_9GAST|nr:endonuclease-reverse transcriptase [Elysia marginata]
MMYGCEAWSQKKDDDKRIDAAGMWFYRRILRVKWTDKRTNESVLKELKTERTLLNLINARKVKYVGHALRNHRTSLMKTVCEGRLDGRRRKVRPPMSLLTNVTTACGLSLHQIVQKSQDRAGWQQRVRSSIATANTASGDADSEVRPVSGRVGILVVEVSLPAGILSGAHQHTTLASPFQSQTGGQYDPYCSIGWSLVGLGLPPRGSPGAAAVGLTTRVPLLGSVVGGAPQVQIHIINTWINQLQSSIQPEKRPRVAMGGKSGAEGDFSPFAPQCIYLNVESVGGESVSDLSPFRLQRETMGILGGECKISKTRRGVMLELARKSDEEKLTKMKKWEV